jgi:hypothetical protein
VTDISNAAIERSVARSEITEVLHRYANLAVEQADWAAMGKLFFPDGRFILPDGRIFSPNEIHQIVNGHEEPTFVRHHITSTQIDFTNPTTAKADSFFTVYTDLAQPDHWGRWLDEFRREDGRWLLTSRQPVIEGFSPTGWWGTVLIPSLKAH